MRPPYITVVQGWFESKRWGPYLRGEQPLPKVGLPDVWARVAEGLYYIGDIDHAETISRQASVLYEEKANKHKEDVHALHDLFYAALFRNLSGDRPNSLWQQLVNKRRNVAIEELQYWRLANALIWEAYALVQIGNYEQVEDTAQAGVKELMHGYGIETISHGNSLEFSLAPLLGILARHRREPTPAFQEEAQKALIYYKEQNKEHGRLGYCVIFDLQLSFPTMLQPILPSDEAEKD